MANALAHLLLAFLQRVRNQLARARGFVRRRIFEQLHLHLAATALVGSSACFRVGNFDLEKDAQPYS